MKKISALFCAILLLFSSGLGEGLEALSDAGKTFGIAVTGPALTEQTLSVTLYGSEQEAKGTGTIQPQKLKKQSAPSRETLSLNAAQTAGTAESAGAAQTAASDVSLTISGPMPSGAYAVGWPATPETGDFYELVSGYGVAVMKQDGTLYEKSDELTLNVQASGQNLYVMNTATGAKTKASGSVEMPLENGEASLAVVRKITKDIQAGGQTYRVTVTLDEEDRIPADAELRVAETEGDPSAFHLSEEQTLVYSRFFDISIWHNGTELEPGSPVDVTIELLDTDISAFQVVHLDDQSGSAETLPAEGNSGSVTFSTDHFSVFGFGGIFSKITDWLTDWLSITVLAENKEDAPEFTSGDLPLDRGLEILESYRASRRKSFALNLKRLTEIALGRLESVALYSIRDGVLSEVVMNSLDAIISLLDVDGFALVKDTGLREKTEENPLTSEGAPLSVTGMLPKEGELAVTALSGEEALGLAPAGEDEAVTKDDVLAAYDISILAAGEEWQPAAEEPVKVRLNCPKATGAQNAGYGVEVWHILDDGTRQKVNFIQEGEDLVFLAEGFSVYMVVETVLETTIDIEGRTYKVTATYDSHANLPADAKLDVSEISPEDADYLTYLNSTAKTLGVEAGELGYLRLLNISIVGEDGTAYKPNDQVKVTVELMNESETGDLRVVHFGEETEELTATTSGDTVSFQTDSFSLFSFVDLSLIQNVVDAVFGSTYTDKVYENDEIIVSGKMPRTAIVEVNPAAVEIEDKEVLVAYDIKIYAGVITKLLGITWQPTDGALTVKLKSNSIYVDVADVYHIADSASEAEMIATEVSVSQNSVTFEASSFSVYAVTDTYFHTYKFYVPTDASQTAFEEYQIYTDSDGYTTFTQIIKAASEGLVIPQLPTLTDEETRLAFAGWFLDTGDGSNLQTPTLASTEFDFSNIPEVTSNKEYHLYARFASFAYVIFHEQYNGATQTWPITATRRGELTGNPASTSIVISDVSVSYDDGGETGSGEDEDTAPAMAFRGWTLESGLNAEKTKALETADVVSSPITISENTDLYPVFVHINWLTFVSGPSGSGASYFPPEYYYIDENISDLASYIPTRRGYSFAGWYTGDNGTGVQLSDASGSLTTSSDLSGVEGLSWEDGKLKLSKNVTIYAKWTPGSTSYAVIIWKQSVDDQAENDTTPSEYDRWYRAYYASNYTSWISEQDENLTSTQLDALWNTVVANAAETAGVSKVKNYDFVESHIIDATAETTATVDNAYKAYSYTGFHYAMCDPDTTVDGNGTTVLNVYYDRDPVTYNFYRANGYSTNNTNGTYGRTSNVYHRLIASGSNRYYLTVRGQNTPYTGTVYIVQGNTLVAIYDWSSYVQNENYYARTYYNGSNCYLVGEVNGGYTYLQWRSYSGTRYSPNWNLYTTMTGLYGQNLEEEGYSWPSEYYWRENFSGVEASGTGITYLDAFNAIDYPGTTKTGDTWSTPFYSSQNAGNRHIYHVLMDTNGVYSMDNSYDTRATSGAGFNLTDKYEGFRVVGYSYGAFTDTPQYSKRAGEQANEDTSSNLYVYHERIKYNLVFLDGYATGRDDLTGNIYQVYYDAPLSSYSGQTVPSSLRVGYEFAGWYYDYKEGGTPGTTRVDFSTARMPMGGMVVYACWQTEWYLIQTDPNGGAYPENSSYSTWFWKQYGTTELVTEYGNTTRDFIESLDGTWYYAVQDREYYELTDEWEDKEDGISARKAYYTQDISDPAIVDLSVRYKKAQDAFRYANWYEVLYDDSGAEIGERLYNFNTAIDHNMTLRLHWKQVGTYYIRYDAGDGTLDDADNNEDTFKILDSSDYIDHSDVVVTRVAHPPKGYNFVGWKIRGGDGTVYYPGEAFEFQSKYTTVDNGKEVLILDAVYSQIGLASIIYDANGGTIDSSTVDYGHPTADGAPKPATDSTENTATIANLINNSGITLSIGTGFSLGDAELIGWNTEPDGSGEMFTLGGDYYVDTEKPIKLYAIWQVKVYFDKNNANATWGGNWDGYTWDSTRGQYYITVYINNKIEEPSNVPVSSVEDERFAYWSRVRYTDSSTVATPFDFANTTITGETTLYGFWANAIQVPYHVVDSTDQTLDNVDSWIIPPEYFSVNTGTIIPLVTMSDTMPYVTVPSGYEYAFACVSDSMENCSDASDKVVSRISYNTTGKCVQITYKNGTTSDLPSGFEIYLVYDKIESLDIGYKTSSITGVLENQDVNSSAPIKTTDLGTYDMASYVIAPKSYAGFTGYYDEHYYTYAIGAPNAENVSQLTYITESFSSDNNRPNLQVRNTWRGFQYYNGSAWVNCGYDIQLYVVYYDREPRIITIGETTIGPADDIDTRVFHYEVEITNRVNSDGDIPLITFDLKSGETKTITAFYWETGWFYTTEHKQTVTVTQKAVNEPKFETDNDGSGRNKISEFVWTYETNSENESPTVIFTNTRKPVSFQAHVALMSGASIVNSDSSLRSETESHYTLELEDLGSVVNLTSASLPNIFTGDTTIYTFAGIAYGTEDESGNVTILGNVNETNSVTYGKISGNIYEMYLNSSPELLVDDEESNKNYKIYFVYYEMPRIYYMKEALDGTLTQIVPIQRNGAAVTLNNVTVAQGNKLNVDTTGMTISQSGSGNYRVPQDLDGRVALSLDYKLLAAGPQIGSVRSLSDLEAVTNGKNMQLKVIDSQVKYSIDNGATWCTFEQEPTIYIIYKEKGYDLTITKTVNGDSNASSQEFALTISSTALSEGDYVVVNNADNSTSPLTATVTEGTGSLVLTVTNGSNITVTGLPEGNYYVTEDAVQNCTMTAQIDETTATVTNNRVTIQMKADHTLAIINTISYPAPTGINLYIMPFAVMLVTGMLLLPLAIRRKHKKEE